MDIDEFEDILGQLSDDDLEVSDNDEAEDTESSTNEDDENSDQESDTNNGTTFKWVTENPTRKFNPTVPTFEAPTTKFNLPLLTNESTPWEVVKQFITDDMIETIVEETNIYADSIKSAKPNAMKSWTPVHDKEMWLFIGLKVLTGILKKPSIRDYWSTNSLLETPIFARTMSRDRCIFRSNNIQE